jgi:hypothetical protein
MPRGTPPVGLLKDAAPDRVEAFNAGYFTGWGYPNGENHWQDGYDHEAFNHGYAWGTSDRDEVQS